MKSSFKDKRPFFLHSIKLRKELRILVLAPHPDDFDTIGITMRFFRDHGSLIYITILSSGAKGVQDDFCSPSTPKVKAQIRENEQRESCKIFGLPESHLKFLRLEENSAGYPIDNHRNFERVQQCMLNLQPVLVFLPHGNDTNLGHQRTYSILRKVILKSRYPITAFLNKDAKTIRMRKDVYTFFGPKDAEWKGQLLRIHQSQQHRNLNTRNHGFDERILRVNSQTALEIPGVGQYAEVFELKHWNQ